jgi:hypothetical protein
VKGKMNDHPPIKAGNPSVLSESPPGENRWGFYQFPDLWRAPGGEIYCAVNVGHDCLIGQHEPSRFFLSRDNGRTWAGIPYEQVDRSPDIVDFSDGSQVAFGESHFIYHLHSYGAFQEAWQWWELEGAGLKPAPGTIWDSYANHEYVLYRYDDIPAAWKTFPRAWRRSRGDPWQRDAARVEAAGMVLGVVARAWWWDAANRHIHEDLPHRFPRPWPRWGVTRLPDDTLLWPYFTWHPDSAKLERLYGTVILFASTDRGRTWRRRGTIADDTDQTSDGYSGDEHSLQRLANGDLYCVMRTVLGDRPGSTMHLAASRSTDNGCTWSRPQPIAPFSVTPILLALDNGVAAVVYGRPGVYVRVSGDSGRTWSEALPVVGPPEAELLADRWWDVRYDHHSDNKISCGNLGAVITGPDRFLLAYSDFRHRNRRGEQCKAVMVREFAVG